MKQRIVPLLLVLAVAGCATPRHSGPGVFEVKDIAESAYIYGFPMIGNYKALYEFTIDKQSGQYKGPFNQIANDARVFTPQSQPRATMARASSRACSLVCMKAAEPNFTSSTSASRLSASFFERIEAVINGMLGTVPVTSRKA